MSQSNEKIVNVDQLIRARKSVRGRQARLRTTYRRFARSTDSPIQEIGVFKDEIDSMEEILDGMISRIDNAKVII